MHRRIMPVCLALALAFTAQPVRAQVCAGFPGFRTTPIQFSAGASFNTDASSFGGSVTAGKDLFGGITVATTHYDAFDASSVEVGLGGGYDFAVESSRQIFICPSVGIHATFGPNDLLGTGINHDAKGFTFGFDAGGIAVSTPRFQLIPTAGLGVVYVHDTFEDGTDSESVSDAYGIFDVGLGFVIADVFTIRPALLIPFAVDESNVTFGLTFAINVGHRATAE
jgi:hypothetical protein